MFGVYFLSFWLAESLDANSNRIQFSGDMGRPWNYWDYFSVSALVMSISLFVVSLMFLQKDD